ncbi:MAG: glycosyltransferase [bacterium]
MTTILHTEASMGFGGQEKRIIVEMENIARDKFKSILATRPGSKIGKRAENLGYKVYYLKMRSSFDLSSVIKLISICKKEKVDIIHTHSSIDSWLGGFASKLYPRPWIIRTRHIGAKIGNRFVYTKLTDKIITVSKNVKDYLASEGISRDKIIAIPTGVDTDRFNPELYDTRVRTEFGINEKMFLIGIIAVLRNKKGHRYLIKAIEKLKKGYPCIRLLIVGEGPQEGNLKALIQEFNLEDTVIMTGNRQDIPQILKALDLFVLPSYEEALGTAIIEAQSMGKPVISTRAGGIPEIVKNGQTGLLTEPEDVDDLSKSIEKVVKDSTLAKRLGLKARQYIIDNYSQKVMISRIEEFYKKMINTEIGK